MFSLASQRLYLRSQSSFCLCLFHCIMPCIISYFCNQFLNCGWYRLTNTKFTIIAILSVGFSGIKYNHNVSPSPPSISRTPMLSSWPHLLHYDLNVASDYLSLQAHLKIPLLGNSWMTTSTHRNFLPLASWLEPISPYSWCPSLFLLCILPGLALVFRCS